jgi:acyl-CoA reductase-like NAD-dependent aldehyde dehydrogenase
MPYAIQPPSSHYIDGAYAEDSAGMKHVTLEPGGKSPLVIFDDADLDSAVSGAIMGNFYSTGQVCSNGTRVFVQRGIKDAFLARLTERLNGAVNGLAAGVFTAGLTRGHRRAAGSQAGTCFINASNLTPVEAPFGGMKQSGVGRENAHAAINH